jgi:hypothetical protein
MQRRAHRAITQQGRQARAGLELVQQHLARGAVGGGGVWEAARFGRAGARPYQQQKSPPLLTWLGWTAAPSQKGDVRVNAGSTNALALARTCAASPDTHLADASTVSSGLIARAQIAPLCSVITLFPAPCKARGRGGQRQQAA